MKACGKESGVEQSNNVFHECWLYQANRDAARVHVVKLRSCVHKLALLA